MCSTITCHLNVRGVEYVVFVAPTKLQLAVYSAILSPSLTQRMLGSGSVGVQGLAMSASDFLRMEALSREADLQSISSARFRIRRWYVV